MPYSPIFFLNRYQTKETIIREHVLSTAEASGDEDTPFIDLIVCPSYAAAYKDKVLEKHGMDKGKYRSKGYYTSQNYSDEGNLRKIFDSITYDPTELLHKVQIGTLDKEKAWFVVDFSQSNIDQHIEITTKYWSTYGKCYSIQPKDHILKLGVKIIDIVARMDIYIYFGYPGQFMLYTKTKVNINKNVDLCVDGIFNILLWFQAYSLIHLFKGIF